MSDNTDDVFAKTQKSHFVDYRSKFFNKRIYAILPTFSSKSVYIGYGECSLLKINVKKKEVVKDFEEISNKHVDEVRLSCNGRNVYALCGFGNIAMQIYSIKYKINCVDMTVKGKDLQSQMMIEDNGRTIWTCDLDYRLKKWEILGGEEDECRETREWPSIDGGGARALRKPFALLN